MGVSKLLVTGASGFIGSALTKRLLEDGNNDVRVLVRNRQKLSDLNGSLSDVVEGDITDSKSVDRATCEVKTIFHVAGAFREPGLSDQQYADVNVEGTRNVLRAALKHGVRRVIHCSTSGIHGSIQICGSFTSHASTVLLEHVLSLLPKVVTIGQLVKESDRTPAVALD